MNAESTEDGPTALEERAAKLENVKWTQPNQSFTATCPINSAHRIAVSSVKTKCLHGCGDDLVTAFFTNGAEPNASRGPLDPELPPGHTNGNLTSWKLKAYDFASDTLAKAATNGAAALLAGTKPQALIESLVNDLRHACETKLARISPLPDLSYSELEKEILNLASAAVGNFDQRAGCSDFKPGAAVDPDVERLAKLSPLEYDKCRKAEAKKLGVRADTLDEEVAKARKQYQAEHTEPKAAPQWTPMPQSWTEAVDGQALIAELVGAIRRFVMIAESAALVVALWVLFTWVFEAVAETNPYLRIISPAPGCGKSTLLKVPRRLVRSGWLLVRLSPSSFARTMDKERRTLLLDEGDAFLNENEIMRNLLDGASDPDTATVSLSEKTGDNWQPIELNVFVPISIASIGPLRKMETVEDRGIPTHLERATGAELKLLDKGRRRTLKEVLEPLALKCAKWASDNAEALRSTRPEVPDTMIGREQDKWEPLIAIADALGGEFGKRVREIALKVSASRGDDGATVGLMLIADLQGDGIFAAAEFVSTATILEELHKLEHRPWPAYGRAQKPISGIQLARLLKPFGVFPASSGTARGYKRSDLEDAFIRYPANPPSQPVNPSETSRTEGESDCSNPSSEEAPDGSKNGEIPWESKTADTLTGKDGVDALREAEIDRLAAADAAKDDEDEEVP